MRPAEPEGTDAALRIDDAWWPRAPRPGAPFRHTVGARSADMDAWLRPRPADGPLVAWKGAMLDAVRPQVFATRPGSKKKSRPVLELVLEQVRTGPKRRLDLAGPETAHPLETAARLVAEDLCVLDVSGESPVLVAAAVTMPNRWLLADKIGRDLLGVHAPVPGYAQDIGTASDRLLSGLAEGRVLARGTWNLVDDPALFQPSAHAGLDHGRDESPPVIEKARDAARHLWVRTEYQTLRALPGGVVLFTIRTGREPLAALAERPDRAEVLLAVLEAMPAEQHEHKGVTAIRPVTAWLRRCQERRLA